jgi:hypothetical protein
MGEPTHHCLLVFEELTYFKKIPEIGKTGQNLHDFNKVTLENP